MRKPPPIGRMTTAQALHDLEVERITSLKWPLWPYLPMKRATFELGFLYADNARDADGVKLYHANVVGMNSMTDAERAAIRVTEYRTVEALLSDGWRIN